MYIYVYIGQMRIFCNAYIQIHKYVPTCLFNVSGKYICVDMYLIHICVNMSTCDIYIYSSVFKTLFLSLAKIVSFLILRNTEKKGMPNSLEE